MCTLTLRRSSTDLLVTMNRDEQRDRAEELPPHRFEGVDGAPAWIAPRDGAFGGTWIGASECGVAACLLNAYRAGGPATAALSRGKIIPGVLALGEFHDITEWLETEFDPSPFAEFRLVVAGAPGTRVIEWDGKTLLAVELAENPWAMLTSSSWNQEAVAAWRRGQFDEWVSRGARFGGQLPAFHVHQPEGWEAWSPLMSREQTHTRSITQVRLDFLHGAAEVFYDPVGARPENQLSRWLEMPLARCLSERGAVPV
ncbi:NRDE family protein [Candidatus Poribacteria bacterium]|nr:NRDE family protein [Candidatus Poribacteria bacterium]